MTRTLRLIALLGLLQSIAGCAAARSEGGPIEYVDERTAATITSVRQPLVFARERRERAANTRDYVTLAAAAVNRSGKISYVLIAYVWSTVDLRGEPRADVAESLVLAADDRRIRLSFAGSSAADQGIAQPVHAPPKQNSPPNVYRTDLETLRFISAARRLTLQIGTDGNGPAYELWTDARGALAEFVRFMAGER
ncbi:MAG: hypothetical protein WCE48_01960 [Steroidobacteraceae bacterium]